jgi:tRNA pseudouridine38-40 synthase
MVRNLTGALVAVGRDRLALAVLEAILAAGDRGRAPPTAPPGGLCLEAIWYPEAGSAPALAPPARLG